MNINDLHLLNQNICFICIPRFLYSVFLAEKIEISTLSHGSSNRYEWLKCHKYLKCWFNAFISGSVHVTTYFFCFYSISFCSQNMNTIFYHIALNILLLVFDERLKTYEYLQNLFFFIIWKFCGNKINLRTLCYFFITQADFFVGRKQVVRPVSGNQRFHMTMSPLYI